MITDFYIIDSNRKTGAHIAQNSQPRFPLSYLSHFRLYILEIFRTFSRKNSLDTDADIMTLM